MRRLTNPLIWLVLFALILGGCAPATPPPTPTPVPTPVPPTPTPLPYDLSVNVVDEAGAAIADASIAFSVGGESQGDSVKTDTAGSVSWNNLPADAVSLNVAAQGYVAQSVDQTIDRGPNTISVTMQRDPFGLLPSEACPAGQKVLYMEDFQDGQAQNWPFITASVAGDMPSGWTIVDEDGNKVLKHADAPAPNNNELQEYTFDNFAWHAKFKVVGNDADMFFMWRMSHPGDQTKRYVAVLSAQSKPWMIRFIDQPGGTMPLNTASAVDRMKEDQWYDVVVTYFDGVHQVWYDGKKEMEYKDSQPFPEGAMGFETHLDPAKVTQFFIDDMVVCELTAAYEPPAE